MKQEYVLVLIVGLLIAAYVLEAIVKPLGIDLATPYHFITSENLSTYPFTTTVIVVRGLALFIAPIWLLSFFEKRYFLKGAISLTLAGLTQLYVLQELATGNAILPLEWALALALGGIALLPVMVLYFIRGVLSSAHTKLVGEHKEKEAHEEKEPTESQE